MKSANSRGPVTEPCGTPDKTGLHLAIESPTLTAIQRFAKNFSIIAKVFPVIPKDCNFINKRECGTESNVLQKSK